MRDFRFLLLLQHVRAPMAILRRRTWKWTNKICQSRVQASPAMTIARRVPERHLRQPKSSPLKRNSKKTSTWVWPRDCSWAKLWNWLKLRYTLESLSIQNVSGNVSTWQRCIVSETFDLIFLAGIFMQCFGNVANLQK